MARRKMRLALMNGLRLGAANVQSHVSGSVTVVKALGTGLNDGLKQAKFNRFKRDVLAIADETIGNAGEERAIVREGIKGQVMYLTLTTREMIAQAGKGAARGQVVTAQAWPEAVAEQAQGLDPISAEQEAALVEAGVPEELEPSEV